MISVILKVLTAYYSKITNTHKNTDQANKYNKQQDKNDKILPCFPTEIKIYWNHTFFLPLSLPYKRTRVQYRHKVRSILP